MKHHVYKLEDEKTGEFYYGSRTCKGDIKDDKLKKIINIYIHEKETNNII
jgi:hypothetical protein